MDDRFDVLPVRIDATDWLDIELPTAAVADQLIPPVNGDIDELLAESEFDLTN